jgi:hypothetical protein
MEASFWAQEVSWRLILGKKLVFLNFRRWGKWGNHILVSPAHSPFLV